MGRLYSLGRSIGCANASAQHHGARPTLRNDLCPFPNAPLCTHLTGLIGVSADLRGATLPRTSHCHTVVGQRCAILQMIKLCKNRMKLRFIQYRRSW